MKRLAFLAAVGILSTACSRHHDPAHIGALPGSAPQGTTTSTTYGGQITPAPVNAGQTYRQVVPINADVIAHDLDRVETYLCKNQDCSTGNLPSVQCSQAGSATTPCYATTPNYQIYYGHNEVGFINAADIAYADLLRTIILSPGYSSYFIKTTITR